MKTNITKKMIFGAAILAALMAAGLLQNTSAQNQSAPQASPQPAVSASLPPDIQPESPLGQVIRLAQSGVDESIILSYVNNSGSAFNLTSDQIIYLKDIGLPSDAVTAMIQRDQQLKAMTAAPAPAPVQQATVQVQAPPPQPVAAVSDNYFYDTLSPYGGWVNVEGYGLCWRPTVVVYDSEWQPYSDHGHWVYTDAGWYWLSDYSWGATTFHYGRWFRDSRVGWCWYPDTVWAPSWVTWRYSDDYCGWAPLPPRTVYREGVGIFYNGVAVSAGFDFGFSVNFFTFVPTRNFCDPNPRRYRPAPVEVTRIYNRTTIINNITINNNQTVINNGIPAEHIRNVTHTELRPVAIRETSTPAVRGEQPGRDGRTLEVNRPHFAASAATSLNNGVRPAPAARQITARPVVNGNGNANGNNPAQRAENPRQNNFPQQNQNQNVNTTQPQPSNPAQNARGMNRTPQTPPPNTAQDPNMNRAPQNRGIVPAQPQQTQPRQQQPPVNYSQPAPAPDSSYDPNKRVFSPRQQQIQEQTPPRITPRTAPDRQNSVLQQQQATPPAAYNQAPPAAPAGRSQGNAFRQNNADAAPRNAPQSAPGNNTQSGSQRPGNRQQDQNGLGN